MTNPVTPDIAQQSQPRPVAAPGAHDRAARHLARPPRPGQPFRASEQARHVFHELHADGRHALCDVCDSQYGADVTTGQHDASGTANPPSGRPNPVRRDHLTPRPLPLPA